MTTETQIINTATLVIKVTKLREKFIENLNKQISFLENDIKTNFQNSKPLQRGRNPKWYTKVSDNEFSTLYRYGFDKICDMGEKTFKNSQDLKNNYIQMIQDTENGNYDYDLQNASNKWFGSRSGFGTKRNGKKNKSLTSTKKSKQKRDHLKTVNFCAEMDNILNNCFGVKTQEIEGKFYFKPHETRDGNDVIALARHTDVHNNLVRSSCFIVRTSCVRDRAYYKCVPVPEGWYQLVEITREEKEKLGYDASVTKVKPTKK